MKPTLHYIAGVLLAAALTSVAGEGPAVDVSVKALPPSVVKTVPISGDTAVDPALQEIRVTFSKDMMTNRMWAICQVSDESYPNPAGAIHYVDNRTCVMPVKLEPGKAYVLWFNRAQFNSFRDSNNHPAIPYMLSFETRK
jgi:hypothetical protein